MKKATPELSPTEMRDEYDFTRGVRGRYAKRFAERTNIVKLDPDVAGVFSDAAAVNRALRRVIRGRA